MRYASEIASEASANFVLLVEDDEVLREELARALRLSSFRVLTAGSALKALELVREYDGLIDWLVTDVELGEMSGVHVAFEYRFMNPTRPIVFLTGFDRPSAVASMSGSTLLQKPFSAAELVGILDRFRDAVQGDTIGL